MTIGTFRLEQNKMSVIFLLTRTKDLMATTERKVKTGIINEVYSDFTC